jgi:predicted nucleic acid-binding Zn ribbon protein
MTARERVLAQWRGVNLGPLEKARSPTARPVSTVLPRVLSELRIERRLGEAEIVRVWNHLIDPTITAHAQPVGIRKGTLFVSVDSSTWHCEIMRFRRREILERLQHSFGKELIARISFRVG